MQPGGGSIMSLKLRHSSATAKKDPENETENSCDKFFDMSL